MCTNIVYVGFGPEIENILGIEQSLKTCETSPQTNSLFCMLKCTQESSEIIYHHSSMNKLRIGFILVFGFFSTG